jgi:hypothetical protein
MRVKLVCPEDHQEFVIVHTHEDAISGTGDALLLFFMRADISLSRGLSSRKIDRIFNAASAQTAVSSLA